MEPYSHNHSALDLLMKLNDEMVLELLPALIWLEVLIIFGIVGNVLVVYVFFCRLRLCTQNFFIIWLAIFDLLSSAIAMPSEMQDLRNHLLFESRFLCRFMRFLNNYCAYCSVFTLTAIAADRYRNVCQPLKQQITVEKAKVILMVILATSVPFTIPAFFLFGLKTTEIKPYGGIYAHTCSFDDSLENGSVSISVIYVGFMIFAFSVTSLTLTFVYIRIWQMANRHYLNLMKNGMVKSSSSMSSSWTPSERWLYIREKRRLMKPSEDIWKNTHSQTTQDSGPALGVPASLEVPVDLILKDCCGQIQNDTSHLTDVGAHFADETVSEMSAPEKSAFDREKSEQQRDNARSRRESIWPDVVDMIKQAGTDSTYEVLGGNRPPQNATEISEPDRFQKISQAVGDAVFEVCSIVSDNIYPSNNLPPIWEDTMTSIDYTEYLRNAADVDSGISKVSSVEGDATDPLTVSPEAVTSQPQQTVRKEVSLARKAPTRDTAEGVGDTQGRKRFCTQPGEASASTKRHKRADLSVKTSAPIMITNSTVSAPPSRADSASTKRSNSSRQSLIMAIGNTLSLSTIPVLGVLTSLSPSQDDSTTNVAGHISMDSSNPVKPMKPMKPFNLDKVTKTAVTITAAFIISFLPYVILITVSLFLRDLDVNLRGAKLWLYHIFIRSFFLNAVSNPIIYAAQSNSFRSECFHLVQRLGSFTKRAQTSDA